MAKRKLLLSDHQALRWGYLRRAKVARKKR